MALSLDQLRPSINSCKEKEENQSNENQKKIVVGKTLSSYELVEEYVKSLEVEKRETFGPLPLGLLLVGIVEGEGKVPIFKKSDDVFHKAAVFEKCIMNNETPQIGEKERWSEGLYNFMNKRMKRW